MTTVSTGNGPQAIGASDQDLRAGDDVGEYRIERVLGKGGFGTVYGGIQPVIGKQVAIKVLARKFSADPDIVSRFVAEAKAVNQIRHRNIIDIFSFGQLPDGRHYYVMEYLDGEPLDAYLREHGPMSLDEALPILRAIARALDAAHAKGIAHRDLKPENILLASDSDGGRYPKLLDFGIAKLLAPEDDVRHKTGTGVPIGTPYYMSPEQSRGREVDHRTDIYSFGIVTYRLLTGTFPFDGDGYMDLLFKQINDEAPPPSSRNPSLTAQVDYAIGWMMRKDREQRPPSVLAGVNALDPTQAVTPTTPLPRATRSSVAPPIAIASAKTTTPDALAATYTPEFERPAPPRARPGRLPLLLLAALLLLAGGAVVAYTMRSTKSTVVAPAPTAAPVAVPAASPPPAPAPPAAEPVPEPPAAVTETAPTPPEPAAKKRIVKKAAPSTTMQPKTEPAGEQPQNKGDIIHSGDIFGKGSRN